MKLAVTGHTGFLGFHVLARLRSMPGFDAIPIGRAEFTDPQLLDSHLSTADGVIHLAGVNRGTEPAMIEQTNVALAHSLLASLERLGSRIPVVYGNSVHSGSNTPFGRSKAQAGALLSSWGDRCGASVTDVCLPNLFGEYGRPFYNSVVATFCHQLAASEKPVIERDRRLSFLHAQAAAEQLIGHAVSRTAGTVWPTGEPLYVSELLDQLRDIASRYRQGVLPDLTDQFTRQLFNTYRSYTVGHHWPIFTEPRSDARGSLVEAVQSVASGCQVFYSTTRPGYTRGQHFHLEKFERFMVIQGSGVIRMRRLFDSKILEYPVDGHRPGIVDMPTMYAHSITNTGDTNLITLFFADEVFDSANPDTFQEEV